MPTACQEAEVRYKALEAYPDVPSPVWVLGFPKRRRGAATNLENSALGSAEPLRGEFFYANGQRVAGFTGVWVLRSKGGQAPVSPIGGTCLGRWQEISVGDPNMHEYSCFALRLKRLSAAGKLGFHVMHILFHGSELFLIFAEGPTLPPIFGCIFYFMVQNCF